jgi:hypothetical protein
VTTLRDPDALCRRLLGIQEAIRDEVVAACESRSSDDLARVVGDEAGDTLFAIDRVTDRALLDHFADLSRT